LKKTLLKKQKKEIVLILIFIMYSVLRTTSGFWNTYYCF